MATTARLGIDIVGRDRTRGAFASTQRSLDGINRSVRTIRTGLGGLAGGGLFGGLIASMIRVNREEPKVSAAFNNLNANWSLFARQVGDAGFNAAMVSFVNNLANSIGNADGLARSISALMSGTFRSIEAIFNGIGAAAQFAADNTQTFNTAIGGTGAAASNAAPLLDRFFASLHAGFAEDSRTLQNYIDWFGRMGQAWKSIDFNQAATLENFTEAWNTLKRAFDQRPFDSMKSNLLPEGVKAWGGLGDTFVNVAAKADMLGASVSNAVDAAGGTATVARVKSGAAAFDDFGKNMDSIGAPIKEANTNLTQSQQMAVDLGDAFRSWAHDVMNGAKAIDALKAALQRLQATLLDRALDFLLPSNQGGSYNPGQILSFFGSSGGFGAMGSFYNDFGGSFASGGQLGAGKWGIAGEAGPEIIHGPASITPLGRGGGGVNINVHNYGGGVATVRERSGWGGKRTFDIYVRDAVARELGNPLSPSSAVMAGRGARPAPKFR